MKFHNHQIHTYPADKLVPKSVLKGRTPVGKRVIKKQHIKKCRNRKIEYE